MTVEIDMFAPESLDVQFFYPLEAINAGQFVSPGYGIHPTRKLETYELLFVIRGRLSIYEEDQRFVVGKHQALILWPNRVHGGSAPYGADLSFFWVHFRLHSLTRARVNAFVRPNQLTALSQPDRMIELFHRFLDDQESGISQPLAASHNVMLMLCELARSAESLRCGADTEGMLAEKVSAYISCHFHEQISTSQIAEQLNYNPDYLERTFRREKNTSITKAIHRRRVREARARLVSEDESNISEIAFACGYTDPSYFRRVFKRFMNMTPKEYRALYQRTHINTH